MFAYQTKENLMNKLIFADCLDVLKEFHKQYPEGFYDSKAGDIFRDDTLIILIT